MGSEEAKNIFGLERSKKHIWAYRNGPDGTIRRQTGSSIYKPTSIIIPHSHPHTLSTYCTDQLPFCTLSHSPPLMALTIANSGATGGARLLYSSSNRHPYTNLSSQRDFLFPLSPRRTLHVVSAKRFTSRTGRSDGKNKRGTTTTRDQEQDPLRLERTADIENVDGGVSVDNVDDGYFLPKLPGDEPDFWEGEKWDFLGFFVEYLWAFGFGFAVCLYSLPL